MAARVVAIGLDCAGSARVKKGMEQGYLETLKTIRAQGAWCDLGVTGEYLDETVWTEVLCGCRSGKTGFWSPFTIREGTYDIETRQVYDFQELPPFYALASQCKVAAVDVPHCRTLYPELDGIQVLSWAAHYPPPPGRSLPANLLPELMDRYGAHPALELILSGIHAADPLFCRVMFDSLVSGVSRRSLVCRDLLQRDRWDLFFTVAMESHEAAHRFEIPDHPCAPRGASAAGLPDSPLLAVDQALDAEFLGPLLKHVGPDTYVVIFSPTRSTACTTDLHNAIILPEFLYRWSFSGKGMFPVGQANGSFTGECQTNTMPTWSAEMWRRRVDSRLAAVLMNPFAARIKNPLAQHAASSITETMAVWSSRVWNGLRRRLAQKLMHYEQSPFAWIPASWYRQYWPQMQAFSIPSLEEGRIRINLKGREPRGIVDPTHYDRVCEQIIAGIKRLTDPRTGTPLVRDVLKSDPGPEKSGGQDLRVIWEERCVDAAESPDVGRIGPFPFCRLGGHKPGGFLIVRGPGIEPGSTWPQGDILDIAPTILRLMGLDVPGHFDGRPLFTGP